MSMHTSFDAGRIAVVGPRGHRRKAATVWRRGRRDETARAMIDVDEQVTLVVAASGGGFRWDTLRLPSRHARERPRPSDHDAPQPSVVLLHEPCRGPDRHGRDQRHDEASNSRVKPEPVLAHARRFA